MKNQNFEFNASTNDEILNAQLNIDTENSEVKKKKKKFFFWWWVLPMILLLIGMSMMGHELGWYRYPWESKMILGSNVKSGNLPGMTDEELLAALQKEADSSRVAFDINGVPVFQDGKSEGSLYISNPAHNVYDFDVNIFLDENGTLLYESGRIPPAHYVDYDRLNEELAKGEHEATAYIKVFDGKNMINAVSVSINIVVNN